MTDGLTKNPASRAAGRASKMFRLATEPFEDSNCTCQLQAAYLLLRFGIPSTHAAIVAPLAFNGARS